MKKILLTFLIFPLLVSAQSGELILGELTVSYETVMEKDGTMLYFQGEEMVASRHDKLWVAYENDTDILEAYDTTNDGQPDTFITLNEAGEVEEIVGDGADNFKLPEVVEFDELLGELGEGGDLGGNGSEASVPPSSENLVENLDSIKIPKYHNYTQWAFVLILLGGGYWYWRKNVKVK